jgi:hypothetical protein
MTRTILAHAALIAFISTASASPRSDCVRNLPGAWFDASSNGWRADQALINQKCGHLGGQRLNNQAPAQSAYSAVTGTTSVHNACWQALGIPSSSSYPTNPAHARRLEECKAAGGPTAYLKRRK